MKSAGTAYTRGPRRAPVARPRVGLVLSGGAARGIAHLGVLLAIRENAVPIDLVVAASYGSIVGAYFACGYSLERLIRMCGEFRVASVLNRRAPLGGLFDGEKLAALLKKDLGETRIEDLKTPLAILALDLTEGDTFVFDRGPLVTALRATTAFPGLFPPFYHEGRRYADGGVLREALIETARKKGADIVVFSDASMISQIEKKRWFRALRSVRAGALRSPVDDHRIPRGRFSAGARSKTGLSMRSSSSFFRRTGFLGTVKKVRIAHGGFPGVQADVTLTPDLGEIKLLGFRQVERTIELGRAAAREALPAIRELLTGNGGGR
jgi:predicted acylesterase/phospholipase RssA